jgi:hypothetical protein
MSEIPRRTALSAFAAAAAAAQTENRQQGKEQHKHEGMVSIKPPAVYKPRFFTAQEFETVAVLVELIIPRTDTPGARDAGVHEIIDGSIRPAQATAWRDGLKTLAGMNFLKMSQAEQIGVLQKGGDFFRLVKGATVDAYYSTREGLVQELGWNFNTYLPEFKGCTHPEHQG